MEQPRPLPRLAAAILAVGGALRFLDWLGNRSLWHDEAALALNLMERDLAGLLTPLDYGQMAPPGFLALSEGVASLLGPSELALRLVPLLVSLASLPLFAALVRRCAQGHAQWLACALFAVSEPMVHYAAEFKPYGGDVTAALLVLVLGLRAQEAGFPRGRCLALGIVGALLPWFAFGVTFVMAAAGIVLSALPLLLRRREQVVRLLVWVALPWLTSLAALHQLFLSRMIATPFMQGFWAFSFMPFPPRNATEWAWLPERLMWVFERSAGFDPGLLTGLVAAAGVVLLIRRRVDHALLFLLPGAFALLASALHLYPFFQRFLFFLVPGVAVLIAVGAAGLAARLGAGRAWVAVAVGVALLAMPALRTGRELHTAWRPYGLEPVLRDLAVRHAEGDAIYVYYGAEYVFRYYQQRLALSALTAARHGGSPFTSARPKRAWQQWHIKEAAVFGPGRVWLVFTNVREWGGKTDQERLLAAVERRGRRVAEVEAEGASAVLVEFGR